MRNNVGVHLPTRTMRISPLTEKDKTDLSYGLSQGVDYVAFSGHKLYAPYGTGALVDFVAWSNAQREREWASPACHVSRSIHCDHTGSSALEQRNDQESSSQSSATQQAGGVAWPSESHRSEEYCADVTG